MTIVVFAGPTITAGEVEARLGCTCLPPVAQGDVLRVARQRPEAIGLIDGYFHGVPSVWHKEILWAMAQGIHVFGSASMGALRAAELHAFGMHGIGRIFEAYRDGVLEDDDEVAVLHGPEGTGFAALSEPMVNIRATLDHATVADIITESTRFALENKAKSMFYQDRTWEALVDPGIVDAPAGELASFAQWLEDGRVDLKRQDAEMMLAEIHQYLESRPDRPEMAFTFEWTHFWDALTRQSSVLVPPAPADDDVPVDRVLDEIRLRPEEFRDLRRNALLRWLTGHEQDRTRRQPDRREITALATRFRMELGLFNRRSLDHWLARNDMDIEAFERLIEEDVMIRQLCEDAGDSLSMYMVAELRAENAYGRLLERARHKQRTLQAAGYSEIRARDIGIAPPQLLAWHYEHCLGRPIPDDLDTAARALGYGDRHELVGMLARNYVYSTLKSTE